MQLPVAQKHDGEQISFARFSIGRKSFAQNLAKV
jgi:hypothetical protein